MTQGAKQTWRHDSLERQRDETDEHGNRKGENIGTPNVLDKTGKHRQPPRQNTERSDRLRDMTVETEMRLEQTGQQKNQELEI